MSKKKSSPRQVPSAPSDPFDGVGQSTGTEVWRVEDMKPVPVSATHHGLFFTGDSYLVLHTEKSGLAKTYDLHFWLGSSTSQDESGAAAIFATELDDKLGGKAKQYRQVQDGESPEFLKLFKGGVQYLEGGVKSGFKHVVKDQAPLPTLLQIKGGKADVRVTEVKLDISSLNSGDIFILDLADTITLWSGRGANVQEKAKARGVLEGMKEKRKGHVQVTHLEESDNNDASSSFYSALGATDPSKVSIAPAAADKTATKAGPPETPTLYKLSEGSADVNITEVAKAPLQRPHLSGSSVHALTAGGRLFLWQCKGSSQADVRLAGRVLTQLSLPPTTPVQIVKEGEEDDIFKQHFDWSKTATEPSPDPALASNGAKDKGRGFDEQSLTVQSSPDKPSITGAASPAASPANGAQSEGKKAAAPSSLTQSPALYIPAPSTPESTGPKKAPRSAVQPPPGVEVVKGGPEPRKPIRKLNLDSIWAQPAAANGGSQNLLSPKDEVFILKPKVYEPTGPPRPVNDVKVAPGSKTFPYEELRVMRGEAGIDMANKEEYLSAEDFETVFGKSLAEFKAMAKWKQLAAKKDKGLF